MRVPSLGPTLCDPIDGSPPGSSIRGIFQARVLEWGAIVFSSCGASGKIFMHWRGKWQPTPVFLPGESHGWRSLVGCRQWGRTELDTTEVTW